MNQQRDENPSTADAAPRQWVERVPGASRRARLTPVAGTDTSPEVPIGHGDAVFDTPSPGGSAAGAPASGTPSAAGPNDERLRRDVPPHW